MEPTTRTDLLHQHRQRLAALRALPESLESGVLDRMIRDLEARIEMLESQRPRPQLRAPTP